MLSLSWLPGFSEQPQWPIVNIILGQGFRVDTGECNKRVLRCEIGLSKKGAWVQEGLDGYWKGEQTR